MPEMVEEKKGQSPPAPAPAPGSRLRLALRAWVGLAALAWGGALCFLLSAWGVLGASTVPLGRGSVNAAALGAGAVLAVVLAAFVVKKFGPMMEYSKPGLGRWARTGALVGVGSLALFGAYAFYMAPGLSSPWWTDLWKAELFGKGLSVKPILFPAAGIFSTVLLVTYLLLNRDKWAEFLIETEGELKKVSWPARKEYLGSSLVVVVVVAVISGFLHVVDWGLSEIMKKLGIGF
jgi:preprotein translocase SecE subunit